MKKNILIVGGSSYIGRKLIKLIDKKKYNIYFTYNENKTHPKNVNSFKIDLNNLEEIEILIKNFKNRKVKFDNVIFLQGIIYSLNLSSYTDKKIFNTISLNTLSIIYFTKKILDLLTRDSLIVFVSSISASQGSYDPIYSASKSALHGFTKSLSKWLAPNKKFVCLCPGPIRKTRMFNRFTKKRKNHHIKNNPLKKLIDANEFAKILIDILKPHWKYANGSIININGGVY